MRTVLATVMMSSLYAIGYVLFNGFNQAYELLGLSSNVGGDVALSAALAGVGGASALWLGLGVGPSGEPSAPGELGRVHLIPLIGLGVALLALSGYLLFTGAP